MATRYKRSLRRRFYAWIDECKWTWFRHGQAFLHGFWFGCFIVLMAFYFLIGM